MGCVDFTVKVDRPSAHPFSRELSGLRQKRKVKGLFGGLTLLKEICFLMRKNDLCLNKDFLNVTRAEQRFV